MRVAQPLCVEGGDYRGGSSGPRAGRHTSTNFCVASTLGVLTRKILALELNCPIYVAQVGPKPPPRWPCRAPESHVVYTACIMVQEVLPRKRTAPNPYNGRWKWWYAAISDEMVLKPAATFGEIAKALGKSPITIGFIVNSDMFRAYHARRMQEFRENHDLSIRAKMTEVAELGLDLIVASMKKKGDQLPMEVLTETTGATLDRLGYGAKPAPSTVINNNLGPTDNRVQIAGVSAAGLEEARLALRQAEQARAQRARELDDDIQLPSPRGVLEAAREEPGSGADPELGVDSGGAHDAAVPNDS